MRRSAFTLVELLAVLALLALLAGLGGLSLLPAARRAQAADAIDALIRFDQLCREESRRSGEPVLVQFDFRTNIARPLNSRLPTHQLPDDVSLARLQTESRRQTMGPLTLSFTPLGHAPPYAVVLADRQSRMHRLFFTPLTGEALKVENDAELDSILRATSPRRDAP